MRLIAIHQCQAGMRLAKNVYNDKGLVLLSKDMELNGTYIRRLQNSGVSFIYVHDPRTEDVEIPEMISESTRIRSMAAIRSNFKKMAERELGSKYSMKHQFGKEFGDTITMIIDDLSRKREAMIMVEYISTVDFYLYSHSLNVCMYATMLGIANDYSEDELRAISLGALLHDIGKTQVPLSILMKPEQLSAEEFDIMKKHAEWGYYLLKDEPNIPLVAAHCAFQHHERLNGSGYPRGILEDDIHPYGKLLAVVDSFDAMTSHRVYRPAMLPHHAMEVLYSGAGVLFDIPIIERFRDRVAIYPIGITLILSTKQKGIVVDLNANQPHRPIVRLIEDEEGQPIHPPYDLDLSKHLNVTIIGTDLASENQIADDHFKHELRV